MPAASAPQPFRSRIDSPITSRSHTPTASHARHGCHFAQSPQRYGAYPGTPSRMALSMFPIISHLP